MKGEKKIKKDRVINSPISGDTLAQNAAVTDNIKSNNAKSGKSVTNKKAAAISNKPNVFVRFGRWVARTFKEMGSELKKVSWPTFAKALASTGIVLVVVIVFLLILTGMDALLGFGFSSLIGLS